MKKSFCSQRLLAALLVSYLWATSGSAEAQVSFTKDIAPLLAAKCMACHGPKTAEADYRVDTFQRLMRAGASEQPAIFGSDPEKSELYKRLISKDDDLRMPSESDRLADQEIALVGKWIAEGAEFDGESTTTPLNKLLPIVMHPNAPDSYPRPIPISAIALSSDDHIYVSGYHEILVWSIDGKLEDRIGNQGQRTYSIDFHPHQPVLMSASGTPGELGEVRVFDLATGNMTEAIARTDEVIMDARFSPDGNQIAVAMPDGRIDVLGFGDAQPTRTLSGHSGAVTALDWRHDGKLIASASIDKTAKVFDLEKGRSTSTFSGHSGIVNAVAFSASDDQIISASGDGTTYLWTAGDGRKQRDLIRVDSPIFGIMPAGDHYFVAGSGWLRRMEMNSHKQLSDLTIANEWLTAIGSNDTHVVVGTQSGEIVLFSRQDDQVAHRFISSPR